MCGLRRRAGGPGNRVSVYRSAYSTAYRRRCHPGRFGGTGQEKARSGPVSRVLSLDKRGGGHFSRTPIARRLQQPTRESVANRTGSRPPKASCSLFGLAPGGVYPASRVTSTAVRSYRTISPLPDPGSASDADPSHRRCVFCGTFPGLAAGRRYRPPCPAEPGLSSRREPSEDGSDRRPPGPLRDLHCHCNALSSGGRLRTGGPVRQSGLAVRPAGRILQPVVSSFRRMDRHRVQAPRSAPSTWMDNSTASLLQSSRWSSRSAGFVGNPRGVEGLSGLEQVCRPRMVWRR